jgi:hypothetical protein
LKNHLETADIPTKYLNLTAPTVCQVRDLPGVAQDEDTKFLGVNLGSSLFKSNINEKLLSEWEHLAARLILHSIKYSSISSYRWTARISVLWKSPTTREGRDAMAEAQLSAYATNAILCMSSSCYQNSRLVVDDCSLWVCL